MIVPYSADHYPPRPVLEIALAYPASAAWHGPYVAQLDSGADFTIGPLELVRNLNAPMVRPATLSSPWGEQRSVYVYEVDLRLGTIVLPAVDLAGVPGSSDLLLGRNVLNRLDLRFDGPRLRLHVLS